MAYTRNAVVKQAKSWIGYKESDGTYKEIIDIYNAHTPLAQGYTVKYTDAWCAVFVSAVSIKCGYTAIIPTECSCDRMITLFKNLNCWEEDDSYKPSSGDIIFYDWGDTTGSSSDNTGGSDHVGIVESVSGTTITVIEGNYSNAVKRRTVQVNGQYIRGYGLPNYADKGSTATTTTTTTTTTSSSDLSDEQIIWNYLYGAFGNAYGAAGMMGNLYAESALNPKNLQNSYETKLGYTDDTYTAAVDNGAYSGFSTDSAGYGLAQWTYSSRKKNMYTYHKSLGKSIGDLETQLGFLFWELQTSYASVLSTLKSATSVLEASNAVLTGFEKPADQSDTVKTKRAGYGQTYYDKYSGSSSSSSSATVTTSSYTVGKTYTTQVDALKVRTGAGTSYSAVSYDELTSNAQANAYSNGTLKKGTRVTCKAVTANGSDVWMQIPSGWIAAYYNGSVYVG